MNEYGGGSGTGAVFLVALAAAVIVALAAGGLIVAYNYSPGVEAAAQVRVAEAQARTAEAQAQAQAMVAQSQAYETGQTARQQSYLAFLAAVAVLAQGSNPVASLAVVGALAFILFGALNRATNRHREAPDLGIEGRGEDTR